MSDLLLQHVFDHLRGGHHLSPEDEPAFSAVSASHEAYAEYFARLGLVLVRDKRDFFYFEAKPSDNFPAGLERVAVFSYVLIDHAADQGKPIEEFLFTTHFFVSRLPHLTLDRYAALLRQVDVVTPAALRQVVKRMESLGWVKFLAEEEFRFLRPFYRMFDKCMDLSAAAKRAEQAQ